MRFTGLCTYPHGGLTGAGVFFSSLAALIATCYAMASCRFVFLTFLSDQGNFEDYFQYNARAGNEQVQYRVGVGLFQWLRSVETDDWAQGVCLGYQQTMRNEIADTLFETSRGFAVLGVLLAFVVCLWGFLTACLSFHRLQVYLLRILCFCGALSCGMTLMFLQSSLCTSEFLDRRCEIDQGALIMIVAVIMWVASFMISIIFIRPETFSDEVLEHKKEEADKERARLVGQIAARRKASKDKRRAEREAKIAERRRREHQRNLQQMEFNQSASMDSVDSFNQRHKTTVRGSNNDELEVYVTKRMNRIDRIMQEV